MVQVDRSEVPRSTLMVVELSRASDPFEDLPLTWYPVTRESSKLPPTANVVCSQGHAGLIGEHEIAPDGKVNPSVVCTQDNCSFHEYITLIGWEDG